MNEMIFKEARVDRLAADEGELEQINRHTVRAFGLDELFTFKLALCDNQIDRDFERFSDASLDALAKLFAGKPVILDHARKASNQCARIYAASVEPIGSAKRLTAKCYMVRCDSTHDLITEIEAGIKKEVSVGCMVQTVRCSICGADNRKMLCEHVGGRSYGEKTCHFVLENPTDAYEVSFVAVPAQPLAGVIKNYGGAATDKTDSQTAQRLRATETFLFINKQEEQK